MADAGYMTGVAYSQSWVKKVNRLDIML